MFRQVRAGAGGVAGAPGRLPRQPPLQRTIIRKDSNKADAGYRNYQRITHKIMHNNKDGGHKGMLWMMIPCLLLLGVLFFGGVRLFASSGYLWLIVIAVCVVPHIWMMFKGHGGHGY